MTSPEPGTWLLEKIDAREKSLTCLAEQTQAQIEELTGKLRELSEAVDHLRITRKTLLTLADEPDPAPPPPPVLPDHPAYQQILALFAGTGQLMRAREVCEALDLPVAPKDIQNTRTKLKRLVGLGILAEPEPGLFVHPCP